MKALLFIFSTLAISNLVNASEFYVINQSSEILNHQVATEIEGSALDDAALKCKDSKKWICFDKCIAKTEKIIKILKNDSTGETREDVKYKITFGLTNQKEDQWSDSDSVILSASEFPLKSNFQRKEKTQTAIYNSGVLKLDSSTKLCSLNDGCPIPVTEHVKTKISVDEQLSNVENFSIKTSYTLRMEKSTDLTCKF